MQHCFGAAMISRRIFGTDGDLAFAARISGPAYLGHLGPMVVVCFGTAMVVRYGMVLQQRGTIAALEPVFYKGFMISFITYGPGYFAPGSGAHYGAYYEQHQYYGNSTNDEGHILRKPACSLVSGLRSSSAHIIGMRGCRLFVLCICMSSNQQRANKK